METTVTIHVNLFNRITQAAQKKKVSRSKLIITLLEMLMEKPSHPLRLGRLVQYQERKMPEEWHTFHISLMEDEYEYFQDLRKLLKMSVSLLIALAVKNFLNDPEDNINTDNYRFNSYLIVQEIVDSVICWRLYWGYPAGILQQMKKLNQ
jgi:hypothetical protein